MTACLLGATLVIAAYAALRAGSGCGGTSRGDLALSGMTMDPPEPTTTSAATTQWVWFTQPVYRIAFPAAPDPTKQTPFTTALGMATRSLTRLNRPSGAFYAVQETEYPSGSGPSEQGVVDGSIKEANAGSPGENLVLTSNRHTTIGGTCYGRDYALIGKTTTLHALLCVRGSHATMALTVMMKTASADEAAEAAAFLGSFAISPVAKAPGGPTAASTR